LTGDQPFAQKHLARFAGLPETVFVFPHGQFFSSGFRDSKFSAIWRKNNPSGFSPPGDYIFSSN